MEFFIEDMGGSKMESKDVKNMAENPLNVDIFKLFAKPAGGHMSLGRPVRRVLFWIPFFALAAFLYLSPAYQTPANYVYAAAAVIAWRIIVNTLRVTAQWERAMVLRLGQFHMTKGPGTIFIAPVVDYAQFIDMRVQALNIPRQKVITRDNVPAEIDSVLFFLVADVEKAVVKVQDFKFAISQYAQATLRDVVGGLSLDDLLSEREHIQNQIGTIVEERIKEWGLHVDSIRLLDIELPEDLKKMMSRQASAEREKRATITKAEGDKMAASSLVDASAMMAKSPGAMHLRTLQTIDGLGASPSNTILLFPSELTEALKKVEVITKKQE